MELVDLESNPLNISSRIATESRIDHMSQGLKYRLLLSFENSVIFETELTTRCFWPPLKELPSLPAL